jgi:hypothetical protein
VTLAAGSYDDYFSPANQVTLKTALQQTGKYITLDISNVVFPGNTIPGGPNVPTTSDFAYFLVNNASVVGIVLPPTIVEISEKAFSSYCRITKVTIPASVRLIKEDAFLYMSLTEVTFESAGVTLEDSSFVGDLKDKYGTGGAGTYKKDNFVWAKQ